MDNFDLKKYLAEGKLLKEDFAPIPLNDFGPEFMAKAKEIFGDDVKIEDIKLKYSPSTDTGKEPDLSLMFEIPSTQSKGRGGLFVVQMGPYSNSFLFRNFSKDKEESATAIEDAFLPAFRTAAVSVLGKAIKNPELLTKATIGVGYKYEPKDQADLEKYVASIPKLPVKK